MLPALRDRLNLPLALLLPLLALGLERLFWDQIRPFVWLFFYPTVFISGWLGGLRGGIGAILLSSALCYGLLIAPMPATNLVDRSSAAIISLSCFVCLCGLIVYLQHRLRLQGQRLAGALVAAARFESEQRFAAIAHQHIVGVIEVDEAARCLFANDRFCALTGYGREDLLGQSLLDLTHSDDRIRNAALFGELVARGQGYSLEKRYIRPDGEAVWALVSVSAVDHPEGRPKSYIGLAVEVSEMKRQEQALHQALERWKLAEEAADAGAWDWNLRNNRKTWSDGIFRLFGLDPQTTEASYERWRDLVHPDDLAEAERRLSEDIRRKGRHWSTYRIVLPDGTLRWIDTHGDVVFDASGEPAGMSGISIDATRRKLAEALIVESEERFRALFAHLPVAYQSLDGEGRWLDANQKMADLLGFDSPLDMKGRDFREFRIDTAPGRFDAACDESKVTQLLEGELALRRVDGKPITVLASGRIQRDSRGAFLCSHHILVDISERRAMEASIRQLNAELESKVEARTAQLAAANAAKAAFLANMSHEIRTPLSVIVGMGELLKKDVTQADQRRKLEKICTSSGHLLALTNDILDLSKIEAGQLAFEETDFVLGEVVRRVMRLVEDQARQKGLDLMAEIPPGLRGARLRGDPVRLAQILINLVHNAIKFTDRGGVCLGLHSLGEEGEALRLHFSVSDTGCGIAEADQARLFMPFSQVDLPTSRQQGGTGLGLSISQHLVSLLGGRIELESRVGSGSTFSFELTLPRADPAAREAAPLLNQCFEGSRILLVEDHPLSQEIMLEMLEDLGCVVDVAADGIEALERARGHAFDLILMDMQMPRMDGLSATRAIRSLPGHEETPIIALTANAFAENRANCLAAGMNDHLGKPVMPATLAALLGRWVGECGECRGCGEREALPPGDELLLALARIPGIEPGEIWLDSPSQAFRYCALLERFIRMHRERLGVLEAHLQAGEREAARGVAHDLKGAAGILGIRRFAILAGEIDQGLGKGAEAAVLHYLAGKCAEELDSLEAALALLPRGGAESGA